MSAIFLKPMSFTASSASPAPLMGSVKNMTTDRATYWSGNGTSSFIIDLGADHKPYDMITLVGTNLNASDQWQVTTATNAAATSVAYQSPTLSAWAGMDKPDELTAKAFFRFPSQRNERYIQVNFVSTNPTVEVTRLVVGKQIKVGGIQPNAEQGFDDQSVITSGAGYYTVSRKQVVLSWKFTTTWIKPLDWRLLWNPLMLWAGSSRALLFIPFDGDPTAWQTEAVFGRITTKASGKIDASEQYIVDATITALAP